MDDGLCAWCERPVSGSRFAPYCCRECQDEADADGEADEASAGPEAPPTLDEAALQEIERNIAVGRTLWQSVYALNTMARLVAEVRRLRADQPVPTL